MADEPSNASDAIAPRDGDTAARVISDQASGQAPGGGGLGSRATAASDPLAAATTSGIAPGAPIDVPTPQGAGADDARAEAEARSAASRADAPEPHPTSQ